MKEKSIGTGAESRPTWESLEALARQGVQRLLQQLLEEEVEQVVGRRRYARRDGVDAAPGYRNGRGKPRRLSTMTGTITIRRPRLRGLGARFESRLLPLFKRRTEEVGRLLPELYLHGLAQGDFDLALRGLLGEAAPLSAVDCAAEGGLAGGVRDVEAPAAGRPRARVRVGGRHLRQGRAGERQGGHACRDRGAPGWAEGRPRGGERLSRIDGELGGAAARPQGARAAGAAAAHRRRAPGHLGRRGHGLPDGARAAVLESSPRERARHAAEEAPSGGQRVAHEDAVRGDPGGGRATQAWLPGVGNEEGRGRGGPPARGGLGTASDLLCLPERALEAPAHHERGGVAVRRGAAADGSGQAIQEGGERDGRDLEDPAGRRGRRVRRRSAGEAG